MDGSDDRYRRLFGQTLAGVFRLGTGGEVLDCNDVAARILGFAGREAALAAGAPTLFFDTADRDALVERLRRDGHAAPVELRARRRDGRPAWVLAHAELVREPGGREVLEGSMVDVSDRRELEARLVQAERLASVGTLAAGVAHEVNNPLSYVMANIGYALEQVALATEACRSGAPPQETEQELQQAGEALREARQGAERVRAIVRDLRMYARAEDERRAVLDVAHLLDSALNVARSEITHRARVVRDYRPCPPVLASEGKLGQVFLNLLLNAAHAMPDGKADQNEIRVSVGESPRGRVHVEVADTGSGMTPEVRARAFEPFFTTRPAGSGTGLGLSICQSIVSALGGEIALESAPGRGTRVAVTLPGAVPSQGPAPRPSGPASPSGRRVLVVDDDPGVGHAVQRLLRGNEVVLCTDSAEALARLADDPGFDVVLCDLFMPGTSGMDLFAVLRERQPELARRVVFITAGAYTRESSTFLDQVENERLEKPFEAARLRALVARMPARQRS